MKPIICLTPIKNEEWILSKFLAAASLWADHIIVADQHSSDRSVEIAKSFPKVTLIENSSNSYDEIARQRLLIEAARAISSEALLIALDADEFLTGNLFKYPELVTLRESPPGTTGWLKWQNVLPSVNTSVPAEWMPVAYVDDGREHVGRRLHSRRLPVAPDGNNLYLQRLCLLHYHYVDWEKMLSKIRFYQCLERIDHPEKNSVSIYRFYNKWQALEQAAQPMPSEWIDGYACRGVDITSVIRQGGNLWDEQVFHFLSEYGAEKFSDIQIWLNDWVTYARKVGHPNPEQFRDPRSWWQRKFHSYLFKTQSKHHHRWVRELDRMLVGNKE
jgi:glycosyltransferase involved in cell wall biosynthesis